MYFQMLPNEDMLPPVFKALFNLFGWKKLHSIAEDINLFTLVGLYKTRARVSMCSSLISPFNIMYLRRS